MTPRRPSPIRVAVIGLAIGFAAGAAFTEGGLARRTEAIERREQLADELAENAVRTLDQARALCTPPAVVTRLEPR